MCVSKDAPCGLLLALGVACGTFIALEGGCSEQRGRELETAALSGRCFGSCLSAACRGHVMCRLHPSTVKVSCFGYNQWRFVVLSSQQLYCLGIECACSLGRRAWLGVGNAVATQLFYKILSVVRRALRCSAQWTCSFLAHARCAACCPPAHCPTRCAQHMAQNGSLARHTCRVSFHSTASSGAAQVHIRHTLPTIFGFVLGFICRS